MFGIVFVRAELRDRFPGPIIYWFVMWGGGRADLRGGRAGIPSRLLKQALPAGMARRHCQTSLPATAAANSGVAQWLVC